MWRSNSRASLFCPLRSSSFPTKNTLFQQFFKVTEGTNLSIRKIGKIIFRLWIFSRSSVKPDSLIRELQFCFEKTGLIAFLDRTLGCWLMNNKFQLLMKFYLGKYLETAGEWGQYSRVDGGQELTTNELIDLHCEQQQQVMEEDIWWWRRRRTKRRRNPLL